MLFYLIWLTNKLIWREIQTINKVRYGKQNDSINIRIPIHSSMTHKTKQEMYDTMT